VLGRHDADAVGRACCRAQRAAHALLEAGVLEPVELVAPAEAGIDRCLLLRVLDRGWTFDDPGERRLQPPQGLAELSIRAGDGPGRWRADHLDHIVRNVVRRHDATTIAVTSSFKVASGSRTFHPRDINWS